MKAARVVRIAAFSLFGVVGCRSITTTSRTADPDPDDPWVATITSYRSESSVVPFRITRADDSRAIVDGLRVELPGPDRPNGIAARDASHSIVRLIATLGDRYVFEATPIVFSEGFLGPLDAIPTAPSERFSDVVSDAERAVYVATSFGQLIAIEPRAVRAHALDRPIVGIALVDGHILARLEPGINVVLDPVSGDRAVSGVLEHRPRAWLGSLAAWPEREGGGTIPLPEPLPPEGHPPAHLGDRGPIRPGRRDDRYDPWRAGATFVHARATGEIGATILPPSTSPEAETADTLANALGFADSLTRFADGTIVDMGDRIVAFDRIGTRTTSIATPSASSIAFASGAQRFLVDRSNCDAPDDERACLVDGAVHRALSRPRVLVDSIDEPIAFAAIVENDLVVGRSTRGPPETPRLSRVDFVPLVATGPARSVDLADVEFLPTARGPHFVDSFRLRRASPDGRIRLVAMRGAVRQLLVIGPDRALAFSPLDPRVDAMELADEIHGLAIDVAGDVAVTRDAGRTIEAPIDGAFDDGVPRLVRCSDERCDAGRVVFAPRGTLPEPILVRPSFGDADHPGTIAITPRELESEYAERWDLLRRWVDADHVDLVAMAPTPPTGPRLSLAGGRIAATLSEIAGRTLAFGVRETTMGYFAAVERADELASTTAEDSPRREGLDEVPMEVQRMRTSSSANVAGPRTAGRDADRGSGRETERSHGSMGIAGATRGALA